ncbi:MAG: hypothetical protein LZ172_08195 [Thaumarchaeota archaeon]|nr:hypothetical protein [Candidatus Geocrenenecus arthurdayi]MCL7390245.1 hypothetical protein [Candidatus Geocrenenecus arthurdayi]MCL7397388.1 hypothetical protein [Candidatus Geocrenenecus arthurdayi]MCL7404304.1 hypothetical protein [Candidatus Geocrenenecus arthurdayi]
MVPQEYLKPYRHYRLRYGKGYRYCSSCREAFLTVSKLYPRCGMRLRSKPRREKLKNT